MSKQAPAPPSKGRLTQIVAGIREHHQGVLLGIRKTLAHSIAAGELLLEVRQKKLVPHGGWSGWLRDTCEVHPRQAQRYMQVAKHKELFVGPKATLKSLSTLSQALASLVEPRTCARGPDSLERRPIEPVTNSKIRSGPASSSKRVHGGQQDEGSLSVFRAEESAAGQFDRTDTQGDLDAEDQHDTDPLSVYGADEFAADQSDELEQYHRRRRRLHKVRLTGFEVDDQLDAQVDAEAAKLLQHLTAAAELAAQRFPALQLQKADCDMATMTMVLLDRVKNQLDPEKIFAPQPRRHARQPSPRG